MYQSTELVARSCLLKLEKESYEVFLNESNEVHMPLFNYFTSQNYSTQEFHVKEELYHPINNYKPPQYNICINNFF